MNQTETSFMTSHILTSARIGLWAMEFDQNAHPRLYVDATASPIMDLSQDLSPEDMYDAWLGHIAPEDKDAVKIAFDEASSGNQVEIQYTLHHPIKGMCCIRVNGTINTNYKPGVRYEGMLQDITGLVQVKNHAPYNSDSIIHALTIDYEEVFIVDVDHDIIRTIRARNEYGSFIQQEGSDFSYQAYIQEGLEHYIVPEDRKLIIRDFNAEHAYSVLLEQSSYLCTYRIHDHENKELYHQAKFVRMPQKEGRLFIVGIRDCDAEQRKIIHDQKQESTRNGIIKILADNYTGLYFFNLHDRTGNVVSVSERIQHDTGANIKASSSLVEAFGNFIQELVHPDDWPLFRQITNYSDLYSLLSHKKRHSIIFRRNFDGEYKYSEMTFAKAEAIDEPPVHVAIGFAEIDREYKAKQKQESLVREAEKKLLMAQAYENSLALERALLALQSDETLSNIYILLNVILESFHADNCYLAYYDHDNHLVRIDKGASVLKGGVVENQVYQMPQDNFISQRERMMRNGLLELTSDEVKELWKHYNLAPDSACHQFTSLTGIPVHVRGTIWGCLSIVYAQQHTLSKEEASFFKRCALVLGSAIERKNVYEALTQAKEAAQSEAQFVNLIINSMPIPVFLKDQEQDLKYVRCNKAFAQIHGLTKREIIDRTDDDIFEQKAASRFRDYDKQVLDSDTPVSYEMDGYTKDDHEHTAIVWKQRFIRQDGHRFVLGFLQDITEERQRVAAESFKADISSHIVNHNDHALNIKYIVKRLQDFFHCEHVMLQCNDGTRNDWFIDNQETYCRLCKDCPLRDDVPEWFNQNDILQIDDTALSTKPMLKNRCIAKSFIAHRIFVNGVPWGSIAIFFIKRRYQLQEIGRHVLQLAANAVTLLLQRVDAQTAISRKNEELFNALQEAKQAERTKSIFLATMSHEIRTPLNAVIGFSEFLRAPNTTERDRLSYLDGIQKSSHALLALINDILDLSKLESNTIDMQDGQCDLVRLFDEMKAVFQFRIQEKHLKLEHHIAHDFPVLALKEERIRQILLNLIGNAAKFTIKGGITYTAEWQPAGNTLIVKVEDTGIGIGADKLEEIFNPFTQDGSVRSAKIYEGTGLGLPISKRLAEAAGGKLEVVSAPSKGSTFTLTIPNVGIIAAASNSKEVPVVSTQSTEAVQELAIPEDLHIVLVDDIPLNLVIPEQYLKKIGISLDCISTFQNAEDALKLLKDNARSRRQFVLTDMWMPNMNGEMFARAIRNDPTLSTLHIAAVTTDDDTKATFDVKLFDAILTKPVTVKSLKTLFSTWFAKTDDK